MNGPKTVHAMNLLSFDGLERELYMWKKVVRNVLGETAFHTLENIVKRDLEKEKPK